MTFRSDVRYVGAPPSARTLGPSTLLIYDRALLREHRAWIASHPLRYEVKGGESIKSLEAFPRHVEKTLKAAARARVKDLTIAAAGGGSVGDFAGFLASVFKRGVPLVQIPTTWLSAIDSAHGGKTALNAGGYKNQIGTFYPARAVYVSRALLLSQPAERAVDAAGEARKTALLAGGALWRECADARAFSAARLWALLPKLIEFKTKVVARDPYERRGDRLALNLGHTVGHAIESALGLSHGRAVDFGLTFALAYSRERGVMSSRAYDAIYATAFGAGLPSAEETAAAIRKTGDLEARLVQDKKMAESGLIRFVFLERPGRSRVERVPVREAAEFARKWSRGRRS